MKLSTTSCLLTAALGVAAHPSWHVHKNMHRSVHDKRGIQFVEYKQPNTSPSVVVQNKPAASSPAPNPPSPPAAAPPAPPAAQPPSAQGTQNAQSTASSGTFIPFCKGLNSKRATLEQNVYEGNHGGFGDLFGCNLMRIPSDIVHMYNYTLTFRNAGNNKQACTCWLKKGSKDLKPNSGGWEGQSLFDFTLGPQGQQAIAAESDTQGACTCTTGSLLKTPNGQFASPSVEFDMGSRPNNGASGADASILVATSWNEFNPKSPLEIQGLNVCADKSGTRCSTVFPGGGGEDAYLKGMEHVDGEGLQFTNQEKVALIVTVDYKG